MSNAAQAITAGPVEPESRPRIWLPYRAPFPGGIELQVAPRAAISWEEFLKLAPDNSVALDGIVSGPTRRDLVRRICNFNHHEGVDRLSTRCTAEQVLLSLRMRFFERFNATETEPLHTFVNDPDQDVCLSVWLLAHHERLSGERSEPIINRLVRLEDMFDTTAGAYPVDPKGKSVREMAWIFQPYTDARLAGGLYEMHAPAIANLIISVNERITQHTLGRGAAIDLDIQYERLGGNAEWWLVRETGGHARTGMFHDGCRAFVSYISGSEGKHRYSVGKVSPYIPFSLEGLYPYLNRLEGYGETGPRPWGGSDTTGGCLREIASSLSPAELEEAVNNYCAAA